MKSLKSEDEPLRRALLDIVESARSLASRTQGICELGAHSGRAMEPMIQKARQLADALGDAAEIMSLFGDSESGFKIAHEEIPGGTEKIVIRCVSNVLDSIDAAGEEEVESEKTTAHERIDLRGLTWSIGVPELLSFLNTINKSGTVQVTTFEETFTIVMNEGQIVHAISSASPRGSRLGDVLVAQGSTTHLELNSFLRRHASNGGCIGDAVVKEGIVTRDQLKFALEAQVKQLFQRLFSAKDATFAFYDGRANKNLHQVEMNLTRLLLESSIGASEAEAQKSA